ncbi:relaxase/mobilization nuclease domain-containing protein [Holdemanella porci]|uniref:relaxase/mobilization nuclease domain-containing protein n=1 Tax=Holdemanella porci TaxID=2652276 RepID=UPI001C2C7CED|nr:relaxase/mobilization nuclease domain-containing protein [Holdemanella porci]MBU9872026.1 relaxase/mobilization nuclease domain-containing protein [Holdemanella porci]
MPITKRWPITKSLKEATNYISNKNKCMVVEDDLKKAIQYTVNETKTKTINNEEVDVTIKTLNNRLVSGINCNPNFVVDEMEHIQSSFGKEKDKIIAYHQVQSFYYNDPVDAIEVHEMGIELAKRMYPNYQVLVTTHQDKAHLHNHFIINATSLSGKKLRSDFYGDEGLMKLREVSDTIAKEHGCKIIDDAKLIGHFEKENTIPAYLINLNAKYRWREVLKNEIDEYKKIVSSTNELLEILSHNGYEVKKGKHISIRPVGARKYFRLDTLGEGYTQKELMYFFARQSRHYWEDEELRRYQLKKIEEEYGRYIANRMMDYVASLSSSQKMLSQNHRNDRYDKSKYPQYSFASLQTINELEKMYNQIDLYDKYNIHSFESLILTTRSLNTKIEKMESELKESEKEFVRKTKQTELYDMYLKYYNHYCVYQEELQWHKIPKDKIPSEVQMFLKIKETLGNLGIDEVRNAMLEFQKEKIKYQHEVAELSYLKYEKVLLDEAKEMKLKESEDLIPSIQLTKNMIDFEKSTDTEYFVKIPYTDKYTYILKDAIIWNKYEKGQVYLVNDMDVDLYDEDGKVVECVNGNNLQRISEGRKQDITEMYKRVRTIEKNNGFVFTVDIKMFDSVRPNKDGVYHIRVPYTQDYIDVPIDHMFWVKENKTAQVFFEDGEDIRYYPNEKSYYNNSTQNGEVKNTSYLKQHFEEKKNEYKSKQKVDNPNKDEDPYSEYE